MTKKVIALALISIPLVLIILGLQLLEGCPPEGKQAGCYGPIGKYWTVYGGELAFQTKAMMWSVIVAATLTMLGFFLKFGKAKTGLLALIGLLWTFFLYVYFNPVIIQY